jgi:hypothetical protein
MKTIQKGLVQQHHDTGTGIPSDWDGYADERTGAGQVVGSESRISESLLDQGIIDRGMQAQMAAARHDAVSSSQQCPDEPHADDGDGRA